MKKVQPTWLKVLYIIVFLSLTAYVYWQQAEQAKQDQQAAAPQQPADISQNDTLQEMEEWEAEFIGSGDAPADNKPPRPSSDSRRDEKTRDASPASRQPDNTPSQKPATTNPAAEFGVRNFPWAKVKGSDYISPAGLIYGNGPNREHRLEHIFRHAEDQPNRGGRHGVFDGSPDEILQLLDEAYQLTKSSESSSQVQTEQDGRRTAYEIQMRRRIGFVGGQTGKRQNHPAALRLKLVLDGARVITAYPLWLLGWYPLCNLLF